MLFSKVWRTGTVSEHGFTSEHIYRTLKMPPQDSKVQCSAEQSSAVISSLVSLPQSGDRITGTDTRNKANRNRASR